MIPSHAAQGCGLQITRPKKTGSAVMKTFLARFAHDESGATAIEYGLIAALVSVGIIASLTTLRTNLQGIFTQVNDGLTK